MGVDDCRENWKQCGVEKWKVQDSEKRRSFSVEGDPHKKRGA